MIVFLFIIDEAEQLIFCSQIHNIKSAMKFNPLHLNNNYYTLPDNINL